MHAELSAPAVPASLRDLVGFKHLQSQVLQGQALQLFAYGSLIWRPEFAVQSQQVARIHGHHRALRMQSRLYRGNETQPGLVLALIPGGSCEGMLLRIAPGQVQEVLRQVWDREMVTSTYTPRWLLCRSRSGAPLGRALAFTLPRHSPSLVQPPQEAELLRVLRHARGHYGSTLDYVRNTVLSLRAYGIHDSALERHLRLAERHGLCGPPPER